MREDEQLVNVDNEVNMISNESIDSVVQKEGFVKSFQTSALMGDYVKNVFDEVIKIGMESKQMNSKSESKVKSGKKKNKDGTDKKDCSIF